MNINGYGTLKQIENDIAKNISKQIPENIVNLIVNEVDFKSNVKVMETKNQLLGTIIDLKV